MIGARLKELRAALGLTQVALATQLGVSERTVRNWEADATPMPRAAALCLRMMAAEAEENRDAVARVMGGEGDGLGKMD